MISCHLTDKHCTPCEGGIPALTLHEAENLLKNLDGWILVHDATMLQKKFKFKGFNKTMSFVNAIAWVANQENHHPDLKIGYDYCEVNYTTHAIQGLSENDFICAAKIDQLLR